MADIDNEKIMASTAYYGRTGLDDSQLRALYQQMQPDFDLWAVISEIRRMDRLDGQVKRIHNRIANALTKGGLVLDNPKNDKTLQRLWEGFVARCQLANRQKLISDARGFVLTGNLALQWVLDAAQTRVMRVVQMPGETIRALVGVNGQFLNMREAYAQYSFIDGRDIAKFAFWQLQIARLDPDNFDDFGALGRPLLDANRKRWRQMDMQADDMVIRRRTRAPLRTVHVLKNVDEQKLNQYKLRTESEQRDGSTNYYLNTEGSVTAMQGDENLGEIADVTLLLDSFFAGTPIPKGLLGYTTDLSRDVMEDMQRQFYDDLDAMQDCLSTAYLNGFKLELLLHGLNPDSLEFTLGYAERLTETLTQRTDRALKLRALSASQHTAWRVAGLDPSAEQERIADERANLDPYPLASDPSKPTVTITPNNAGNQHSATSIRHE